MNQKIDEEYIWYATYGSNLLTERFQKYLPDVDVSNFPNIWQKIKGHLYFASQHSRWNDKAIAFVEPLSPQESFVSKTALARQTKSFQTNEIICRLYRLPVSRFIQIVNGENGFFNYQTDPEDLPISLPEDFGKITPHKLFQLKTLPKPEFLAAYERIGKTPGPEGESQQYDGLLRFDDYFYDKSGQFEKVFTVTTTQNFPAGVPDNSYLDVIGRGFNDFNQLGNPDSFEDYIQNALQYTPSCNEFKNSYNESILFHVLAGDEVHVSKEKKAKIGDWALLDTGLLVAPVKIIERTASDENFNTQNFNANSNDVNITYLFRTMYGLSNFDERYINLQKIDPKTWEIPNYRIGKFSKLRSAVSKLFSKPYLLWYKLGAKILGAPAVSLRTVEGLVGDESELIVRVDESTLDFIGAVSGDEVFVSWGKKPPIKARVLVKSDVTSERMKEQLEERGSQLRTRSSAAMIEQRKALPEHITVWLSATLRTRLDIPLDTSVRIRRNPWSILWAKLPDLSLPFVSLVLGYLALYELDLGWVMYILYAYAAIILLATLNSVRINKRK